VCTRPVDVNGLGLTIEATNRRTDQLENSFTIVPDSIQAFHLWRKLVVERSVTGVKVHDARLVAIMGTTDIHRILTFNVSDFKRYSGIEPLHPDDVV
jgi:hypothetical protein